MAETDCAVCTTLDYTATLKKALFYAIIAAEVDAICSAKRCNCMKDVPPKCEGAVSIPTFVTVEVIVKVSVEPLYANVLADGHKATSKKYTNSGTVALSFDGNSTALATYDVDKPNSNGSVVNTDISVVKVCMGKSTLDDT